MRSRKGLPLLRFVKDYQETQVPHPTLTEIQQGMGDRTRQATFKSLKRLVQAGLILQIGNGQYGLTAKGKEVLDKEEEATLPVA